MLCPKLQAAAAVSWKIYFSRTFIHSLLCFRRRSFQEILSRSGRSYNVDFQSYEYEDMWQLRRRRRRVVLSRVQLHEYFILCTSQTFFFLFWLFHTKFHNNSFLKMLIEKHKKCY